MNPKIFGRGTWYYLFFILTLNFKDIDFLKRIVSEILFALPCTECSKHSIEHILKSSFLEKTTQIELFVIISDLRNKFYPPLDPSLYSNQSDIIKNRDTILGTILMTRSVN